jgi:hypothetical protein
MSKLPVVTAKRYDYGAYARPQQVQYRGGAGEGIAAGLMQAGQAVSKALSEKAKEAREREKFIDANKDKIAMTLATENPELFKLNQQAITNFIDTIIPRETDSRAEKNAKIAKYGAFMAKFKAIDDFSERESPIGEDSEDLIAAGSILDNYGHDVIRNNKLEFEFNSTTGEIDFFITYPGEGKLDEKGFPVFTDRKQVDPLKLISSEIQTKYDRDIDMEEAKLNLTPPQLAALLVQNSKYENALGDKRTVDGITSQSFDAGKLAGIFKNDYSDKNPTAIGRAIKNLAKKKGATIWNQYFEEESGDWTGSDEQKKMVYDYVAQDVATKYSNSIVKQSQAKQEDPFVSMETSKAIVRDIAGYMNDGNKQGLTSDETAELFNSYPKLLGGIGRDIEIKSRSGILDDIDSLISEAEANRKELGTGSGGKTEKAKADARIEELKEYKKAYAKRPSDHLFYVKNGEPQEWVIFNKAHDASRRVLKGEQQGAFGPSFQADRKLIGINDISLIIENVMTGDNTMRSNIIRTLGGFKPQADM